MLNKALTILRQDYDNNVNIIAPLENGHGKVIYCDEHLIICDISGLAFLWCDDDRLLQKHRDLFINYGLISLFCNNDQLWIKDEGHFDIYGKFYTLHYPSNKHIEFTLPQGVSMRKLTTNDIAFVYDHYMAVHDKGYIEECMTKRTMFGIEENNQLVGFIGQHDEDTMGLLEILPEHRRKHYGYYLEAQMINHLIDSNQLPFCQVAIDNEASLNLQQKLGLVSGSKYVQWYMEKNNEEN